MLGGALVVCATGLKGAIFVEGLLRRGLRPRAILSYEQTDDGSFSYSKLANLARANGLPFSAEKRPTFAPTDLVFCVGWQYLLREPQDGVVVFHDSLLPRYRGFAPTVAALINGDTSIGVTALSPTGEMDEGPILAQASICVSYPLKIVRALELQASLMIELAVEIHERWNNGRLSKINQDNEGATYSLWRDSTDYDIDWSRPAVEIARFVDAVGYPYAGARTTVRGEAIRVEEATQTDDLRFEIRQPGKIWKLDRDRPIVVCGSGLLRLDVCTDAQGKPYSFPFLRARLGASAK